MKFGGLRLNPNKFREPVEDLKYLNIDYTQFNGWSSDEEVTIYTGIEKGYEEWVLEGPDDGADKVQYCSILISMLCSPK